MTDVLTLSQGEPSGEEDDERVQGSFPAMCSGSRLTPSLTGDVAQSQVEQLHRGLVGREVAARLGDFAQLEVDRLDRVRGVHDEAQLGRVVEKWDELGP